MQSRKDQKNAFYGPQLPPSNLDKDMRLPRNPKRAIQEMMDIIDGLRNIYELETSALDKSDVKAFMAMQDEKIAMASRYQYGIAQMIHRKEEIKQIDPDLKDRLKAMQNEFVELADRNMEALDKMNRCVNRLNGTLRDAAKETIKKERAFSYNELGSMNMENRKQITTGTLSETA